MKTRNKSVNKMSTSKDDEGANASNDTHSEEKYELRALQSEIAKMNGQISQLLGIFSDIKELKQEMKQKDEKIEQLSRRVDELEQYSKKQNIIITGFKTSHKSYARTVQSQEANDNENASEVEKDTLKTRVINFLSENVTPIIPSEIEACHTLPSKDANRKPIVVRFVSRTSKDNVMKNLKHLRDANKKPTTANKVYINEHLTKKNSDIAAYARKLWRQKTIAGTFVRNCTVHIKLAGRTPEENKLYTIKEMNDFAKYGLPTKSE